MSYRTASLRRGRLYVECEAEIDLSDIIADIPEEALRAECAERGISLMDAPSNDRERWFDLCEEIRSACRQGDTMHMEVLIIRVLAMAGVPRLTMAPPGKPKGVLASA